MERSGNHTATIFRLPPIDRSRLARRVADATRIAEMSSVETIDGSGYAPGDGVVERSDRFGVRGGRMPEPLARSGPGTITLWDGTRITFTNLPDVGD